MSKQSIIKIIEADSDGYFFCIHEIKDDIDMRMISYYLDRGMDLEKLMNLSYYEKVFYIASMVFQTEDSLDTQIALNPFIEKK